MANLLLVERYHLLPLAMAVERHRLSLAATRAHTDEVTDQHLPGAEPSSWHTRRASHIRCRR